ncbi:MAG: type-4 uracil-DNA glycosylase [Acidilobaceae archaeon]
MYQWATNVEAQSRLYLELVSDIKKCTKCPLHMSRTQAVPGDGPINTEIVLVGEAPGKSEDEQGKPFVGAAGKLLDKLLEIAGLERSKVYITNVVKCRPPENREPEDNEIKACNNYLRRELSLIKPKLIVALGRIAGKTLYEMCGIRWVNINVARGRVVDCRTNNLEFKLIVTYHPAAALYNPNLRSELERDFREHIAESIRRHEKTKRKLTLEDFRL